LGAIRHTIKDCVKFKRNVLDLLKQNHIQLEPQENANIVANPLPNHMDDKQIGAIEVEQEYHDKIATTQDSDFDKNQSSLKDYYEKGDLLKNPRIIQPFSRDTSDEREVAVIGEGCPNLVFNKSNPQKEGTSYSIVIKDKNTKPMPKVIISIRTPFQYKSDRVMPWKCGCQVKHVTHNITSQQKITHSGRVYTK